jgi:putative oxidoreductase
MATDTDTDTSRTTTTNLGDIGLLVLRIGVGATLLDAGLRKFLDFNTIEATMAQSGWRLPKVATSMIALAETAGGAGLILGLLTPLAAFAAVSAMFDAWAVMLASVKLTSQPFPQPFVMALGGVALLFTGAGALSVDARLWGRARWPAAIAIALLILAIVVAVITWVALNGTNPIHFRSPEGTPR